MTVLDCPAVMEAGLKVQVPLVQARLMLSWNELGAEAVMVNVVDLVPTSRTSDLTLADSEKTALPSPDSATLCGLLRASSSMVRPPARFPEAVGVKVTLMLQELPEFRTAGREPQAPCFDSRWKGLLASLG